MATRQNSEQSAISRRFWTEFIALYESLPALWDVSSSLYKERQAKLDGYQRLVAKMRQFEPTACHEDVLRKINIFRTNYRRECSRINKFHKEGKKYQTSLWYYDLLKFLETPYTSRIARKHRVNNELRLKYGKRKALIDTLGAHFEAIDSTETTSTFVRYENDMTVDNDSSGEEQFKNKNSFQQQFQNQFEKLKLNHLPSRKVKIVERTKQRSSPDIENDVAIDEDNTFEENSDVSTHTRTREILEIEVGEQLYDELTKKTEQLQRGSKTTTATKSTITNLHADSRPQYVKSMKTNVGAEPPPQTGVYMISESSEILARSWAIQYEEMCEDQRIHARKAIADILFEGCMGMLGRRDDSSKRSPKFECVEYCETVYNGENVADSKTNRTQEEIVEHESYLCADNKKSRYRN